LTVAFDSYMALWSSSSICAYSTFTVCKRRPL